MSLFAVIYRYADAAAELDEHRPRHRDHLRGLHEAGRLVVSGPLAEGGGPGALLIFRADSAEQVAGWLDDDPFKVLGLIVEREIRAWNPTRNRASTTHRWYSVCAGFSRSRRVDRASAVPGPVRSTA